MNRLNKLLIVVGVVFIVLIIVMLALVQKSGVDEDDIEALAQEALSSRELRANIEALYEEAVDVGEEELEFKVLEIGDVVFTKPKYSVGEPIVYQFQVTNFMNPKIKEEYYIFGIEEYTDVKGPDGSIVVSMSAKQVDIANHFKTAGLPLTISNTLSTEGLNPGEYTLTILVYDKISKITKKKVEVIIIE